MSVLGAYCKLSLVVVFDCFFLIILKDKLKSQKLEPGVGLFFCIFICQTLLKPLENIEMFGHFTHKLHIEVTSKWFIFI